MQPLLALQREVGKKVGRGSPAVCKAAQAFLYSYWARRATLPAAAAAAAAAAARQSRRAHTTTRCKAGISRDCYIIPGFRNNSRPPRDWCRAGGAILSQASRGWQGTGTGTTTLELSQQDCYCQGCKVSLVQDKPWYPCQCWHRGLGALSRHARLKKQTLHNSTVHPRSECQRLSARPWQLLFLRIQSRQSGHFVAGQHGGLVLPWWPQQLAALGTRRLGTRSYHASSLPAGTQCHVVDLRSDTVTQPSPEMRQAMAQMEVGDDYYGEDPTVNELQSVVADLLGTEGALFVPSATMANLIAVMCHCQRRGAQVLLGREAHIHVFTHGGVAQVAGVHSEILQDMPDGTISLDELENKIQQAHQSKYHPRPELICLENTHSSAGGRVLPLQYLQEVHHLAQQYGLRVHMDGARVLNAAVALGVPPTDISQHCDSISLCLSKGVGAPAGALLAGSRELITEAWRMRKVLGGGMRQAGVLAAAGLVGLAHVEETLKRDHNNARCFAQAACTLGSPLCSVNPAKVETNIVMATFAPWLAPAKLCELMEAVSAEELAATGQAVSVRLFPWGKQGLRAVWHWNVSALDTQLAGNKLRFVLEKCQQQHTNMA
ncbi:uncharacterized protein LOC134394573 [Elgaria multicarinata webbii]|uniref:uncharacterized protein LOC134394573 n=1 Tax=Elgaria multicarinata webbii TaxID=159646 RepID=UPI002FCCE93E